MSIFDQLINNKGTVSSALGKELAQEFFNGKADILSEAITLSVFDADNPKEKNIRSGAAKIVEIIAEKKPELVAPDLEKLLSALSVDEPQTRWMIIRTFGFCAHLNPKTALKALPFAREYLNKTEGLCLTSSADLFLGDLGAVSKKEAQTAFPLLLESSKTPIKNEHDWILEAFMKILPHLTSDQKAKVKDFTQKCMSFSRKATQKRVKKLLELIAE